jgi:hypothetical protein
MRAKCDGLRLAGHAVTLLLLTPLMGWADEWSDALALYNRGDFARACPRFKKVTHLRPNNGAAWADLAVCLAKLGKDSEAVAANHKAVRHGDERTRFNAYFNLSQLGVQLAVADEGISRLEVAPELCPEREILAKVITWDLGGNGGGCDYSSLELARTASGFQTDRRGDDDMLLPRGASCWVSGRACSVDWTGDTFAELEPHLSAAVAGRGDAGFEGATASQLAWTLLQEEEAIGREARAVADAMVERCPKRGRAACLQRGADQLKKRVTTRLDAVMGAWMLLTQAACEQAMWDSAAQMEADHERCELIVADSCNGRVAARCSSQFREFAVVDVPEPTNTVPH